MSDQQGQGDTPRERKKNGSHKRKLREEAEAPQCRKRRRSDLSSGESSGRRTRSTVSSLSDESSGDGSDYSYGIQSILLNCSLFRMRCSEEANNPELENYPGEETPLGAGVSGAGMSGAGMSGAGMLDAGMSRAGKSGTRMWGTGMWGTGMWGAGISGSGISGSGMLDAGMFGAGMSGAGKSRTGISGDGMSGAGMPGAKISGTGALNNRQLVICDSEVTSTTSTPGFEHTSSEEERDADSESEYK